MKTFPKGTLFYLAMAVVALTLQGCLTDDEYTPFRPKGNNLNAPSDKANSQNPAGSHHAQPSQGHSKGASSVLPTINAPVTPAYQPSASQLSTSTQVSSINRSSSGSSGGGMPLGEPKITQSSQLNTKTLEKDKDLKSNQEVFYSQIKPYSDLIQILNDFNSLRERLGIIFMYDSKLRDGEIWDVYLQALKEYEKIKPYCTELLELEKIQCQATYLDKALSILKELNKCSDVLEKLKTCSESINKILDSQINRCDDLINTLNDFNTLREHLGIIFKDDSTLRNGKIWDVYYNQVLGVYEEIKPYYTKLLKLQETPRDASQDEDKCCPQALSMCILSTLDKYMDENNENNMKQLTEKLTKLMAEDSKFTNVQNVQSNNTQTNKPKKRQAPLPPVSTSTLSDTLPNNLQSSIDIDIVEEVPVASELNASIISSILAKVGLKGSTKSFCFLKRCRK